LNIDERKMMLWGSGECMSTYASSLLNFESVVILSLVLSLFVGLFAAHNKKNECRKDRSVVAVETDGPMTQKKVLEAQQKWAEGIVNISTAFTEKKDYVEASRQHISNLYAFDVAPVLFKPTKAAKVQFRSDKELALSYFAASNGVCEEDTGFAINGGNPWTAVKFENDTISVIGDTAIAMGNYYFTPTNGGVAKVEYTFGYILNKNEDAIINLHHSSLPYSG